jgi:hydroxyacylglutathione hydrolase
MLLKRFYDEGLAQASYLIGCQATGDAIVVDPNRDVAQYVEAAAREGLAIRHVTETHIHADFVSGARELAARTGAMLYLSAEGGPDWQYGWAAEAGATLVHEGDTIRVGKVVLTVRHTPGHTPEHLMFEVLDSAGATEPMGVLTGDFVFVGDVGRPDLLEKAAKVANTMEAGAKQLYASLQRFKTLPDWVQIWPGHGAGSACGKALGAVPTSTVGYERRFNWGLADVTEAAFVATVLEGQPEPPVYFAEMKRINRDGPRLLSPNGQAAPAPGAVPMAEVPALLASGAVVVDTREASAFAAGHLPGTLSIPLNKSFSTWAGWLVPYDRPFYILAAESAMGSAVRELQMIGLDDIAGVVDPAALGSWTASGRPLVTVPQLAPADLASALARGVTLVDVRGRAEWAGGHIPGARHIPLGELRSRVSELPAGRPVVVQCQGGVRSAIGASVLQAAGVPDVTNLSGGYSAWLPLGLR